MFQDIAHHQRLERLASLECVVANALHHSVAQGHVVELLAAQECLVANDDEALAAIEGGQ